jgi:hypothetical protein
MLARDAAINATRKDDSARVRVLIRPKLQVAIKNGGIKNGGKNGETLAPLREVICTLNDATVAVLTAGHNFNDSGYFELELRGSKAGDAFNVSWVDVAGNKGRGGVVLK